MFSQSHTGSPKTGNFGVNRLKAMAAAEKRKSNSNSTNSYYISETPSCPDEKELTMCAAKAISLLIEAGSAREAEATEIYETSLRPMTARDGKKEKEPQSLIFDERRYCLKSTLRKGVPSVEDIFKYLRVIYKKTRMQPECIGELLFFFLFFFFFCFFWIFLIKFLFFREKMCSNFSRV
jgi:hypothetical protein